MKEFVIMNEKELKIEIDTTFTGQLLEDPKVLIKKLVELNNLKIQQYMLDNLNNLDGGPSISNLDIQNFTYNHSLNSGTFRLKFQIERRYCCSDTESCVNDYLDFHFLIRKDKVSASSEYFDWNLNN